MTKNLSSNKLQLHNSTERLGLFLADLPSAIKVAQLQACWLHQSLNSLLFTLMWIMTALSPLALKLDGCAVLVGAWY